MDENQSEKYLGWIWNIWIYYVFFISVIFTTNNANNRGETTRSQNMPGNMALKAVAKQNRGTLRTRKRRPQWTDAKERKKKTNFPLVFPLARHNLFNNLYLGMPAVWIWHISRAKSMAKYAEICFVFRLLFSALLYIILERCDICMYKFQLWSAKDNLRVAKANCQARNRNKHNYSHKNRNGNVVPKKNVATFRVLEICGRTPRVSVLRLLHT